MILLEKTIHHSAWIIEAIKESNQILHQDIKKKMMNKQFLSQPSFQKFFYSFTLYERLFSRLTKGFSTILNTHQFTHHNLQNLYSSYLTRAAMYFKDAGAYLKKWRQESMLPSSIFFVSYQQMKQISSYLAVLENDFSFLIKNLYK